jgi:SAM-dependent methyltransferase
MEGTKTRAPELRIAITRGTKCWTIRPSDFDDFPFEDGDRLEIQLAELAAQLPDIWGVQHVPVALGHAIQVPRMYRLFSYRGYRLPAHLVFATGAGAESFDALGRSQFANYIKFVDFAPGMTIVDVGCGIGRHAFQLLDFLGPHGRYHGVDAIRDSIRWCQRNITPTRANFTFQHADARNEVYNPHGSKSSREIRIELADGGVDWVILSSLLTHLLEDEVVHYLKELRRILKTQGLVYATLFLHSAEAPRR